MLFAIDAFSTARETFSQDAPPIISVFSIYKNLKASLKDTRVLGGEFLKPPVEFTTAVFIVEDRSPRTNSSLNPDKD